MLEITKNLQFFLLSVRIRFKKNILNEQELIEQPINILNYIRMFAKNFIIRRGKRILFVQATIRKLFLILLILLIFAFEALFFILIAYFLIYLYIHFLFEIVKTNLVS